MKRHLATVERAMGVLMIVTGIGFLTGAVSNVSIWLLETFPVAAELRLARPLLQRTQHGVDHAARQEIDGGLAAELVARAALDQPRAEAALHRRHHRRPAGLRSRSA